MTLSPKASSIIREDMELFLRHKPASHPPRPFRFGDILRYFDQEPPNSEYRFLYIGPHPAPEGGYGIIIDGPDGIGERSSFLLHRMEIAP